MSLVSHLLFIYENKLNYEFHRNTIRELVRITSAEIRIFPIINLQGNRSKYVEKIKKEFSKFTISEQKIDYEFMKNANKMLIIKVK